MVNKSRLETRNLQELNADVVAGCCSLSLDVGDEKPKGPGKARRTAAFWVFIWAQQVGSSPTDQNA